MEFQICIIGKLRESKDDARLLCHRQHFLMNESRHVLEMPDDGFLVAYAGYSMSPKKRPHDDPARTKRQTQIGLLSRASYAATRSIVCNRSNGTNTRQIAHIDNFCFSSVMCRLLSFYFKWKRSQTHEKRREKKKTCRKRRKMLSVLLGRPSRDVAARQRDDRQHFRRSKL